jgi:hypothetical protein
MQGGPVGELLSHQRFEDPVDELASACRQRHGHDSAVDRVAAASDESGLLEPVESLGDSPRPLPGWPPLRAVGVTG